jgi:hypothetical protein
MNFIKLTRNSDALECISDLMNDRQDLYTGTNIDERNYILKFADEHNIFGHALVNLWMLCDKNLHKMYYLFTHASVHELRVASSMQIPNAIEYLDDILREYKQ